VNIGHEVASVREVGRQSSAGFGNRGEREDVGCDRRHEEMLSDCVGRCAREEVGAESFCCDGDGSRSGIIVAAVRAVQYVELKEMQGARSPSSPPPKYRSLKVAADAR
jgi:hypothetical protein